MLNHVVHNFQINIYTFLKQVFNQSIVVGNTFPVYLPCSTYIKVWVWATVAKKNRMCMPTVINLIDSQYFHGRLYTWKNSRPWDRKPIGIKVMLMHQINIFLRRGTMKDGIRIRTRTFSSSELSHMKQKWAWSN